MTKEQLNDPHWRICNLYWIVDKDGNKTKFQPNPSQLKLLKTLTLRSLILKARQLGFSTLIQIIMLDQCIFVSNTKAGVIAQDEYAASKIFSDKIKFAWDNMPAWVHDNIKAVGDSTRELELSNGSRISVATSMRSGTLQYLHISEFGKICAKFPGRAKEVLTGSLPAVSEDGFCFIESTAEGREGYFFDMCAQALERQKTNKQSKKDFKLHFFPWFEAEEYKQTEVEELTNEDIEYFNGIEVLCNVKISIEQRYWYIATKRGVMLNDSQKMRQEYPSHPEEAFETSTEGSYFANQMLVVRNANRITSVPHTKGYPVHTSFDIGRSDGTAIWCFQHIGMDYRFIRFIENWDQEFDWYVSELQKHGYVFGKHYLPHDAEHRRQAKNKAQSKTAKQMLEELGLQNIVVVPRTPQKILSINSARAKLPLCYFDKVNCANGIAHLDGYRKHWDTANARFVDTPEHDHHSEAADAFMQFADGYVPSQPVDLSSIVNMRNSNNHRSTSPFK